MHPIHQTPTIDVIGLDIGAATSGVSMMDSSCILRVNNQAPTARSLKDYLFTSGLGAGHINSNTEKCPTLLVIRRGMTMAQLLDPAATANGWLLTGRLAEDQYTANLRQMRQSGTVSDFEVYSNFKELLHKERSGTKASDYQELAQLPVREEIEPDGLPVATRPLLHLITLLIASLMATARERIATSQLGVLAPSRRVDATSRRIITMTVPYAWDRAAQLLYEHAAKWAGLAVSEIAAENELFLLHEPKAALLGALALQEVEAQQVGAPAGVGRVLSILDLGGHSAHYLLALMENTGPLRIKEVLALDGNYNGAKEVDNRIMGVIKYLLGGKDFDWTAHSAATSLLMQQLRKWKDTQPLHITDGLSETAPSSALGATVPIDCAELAEILFPGAGPTVAQKRSEWLSAIHGHVDAFNSSSPDLPPFARVIGPSYPSNEVDAAGLLTTRNTPYNPMRRLVNRVRYEYNPMGTPAERRGILHVPDAITSALVHAHAGQVMIQFAGNGITKSRAAVPTISIPHWFITVGTSFASKAYLGAARELQTRGIVNPAAKLPSTNTGRLISQGAAINSYYLFHGELFSCVLVLYARTFAGAALRVSVYYRY